MRRLDRVEDVGCTPARAVDDRRSSVAARRLAGVEIPQSSRAARRASAIADGAWRLLRDAVIAETATHRLADAVTHHLTGPQGDRELAAVLHDVLRERRPLRRCWSTRIRESGNACIDCGCGPRCRSCGARRAGGDCGSRCARIGTEHEQPSCCRCLRGGRIRSDTGPVVGWTTRGTAAQDGTLLTKLKVAFLRAHPEATGQVQVLLVTDTSAYRIAYVTAKSPTGVLESWFYGPVGSNDLVEGVVQYGVGLDTHSGVLATGLADAQGHTELVVLAPPGTRTMRLATSATATAPASPSTLRDANGIAVKSVATGSIASLSLDVRVGRTDVVSKGMRTLALGPTFEGRGAPFEPEEMPSFPAERGHPDPQVLAQAAYDAGVGRCRTAWLTGCR